VGRVTSVLEKGDLPGIGPLPVGPTATEYVYPNRHGFQE
jgi:hypothetical protein